MRNLQDKKSKSASPPKSKNDYWEEHHYKRQAKRAAEDLNYGQDVIDAIDKAKSDAEITQIMTTARVK